MVSEWVTSPYFERLDAKYGHIVSETNLKGAWYRRALSLMHAAERHGGAGTETFRVWQACQPEHWRAPDLTIMRVLSEVPSDQNT
jgi:hypothetical protein